MLYKNTVSEKSISDPFRPVLSPSKVFGIKWSKITKLHDTLQLNELILHYLEIAFITMVTKY
jgi:hypothetical protein